MNRSVTSEGATAEGPAPDFLVDDAALAAFEIAAIAADAPPLATAALAWQLRQRDPGRALELADAARARLSGLPAAARRPLEARLRLVNAEADWLAGRLDAASTGAEDALRAFDADADALGRADAHWLRAMLAIDRGDWPGKDVELQAMARAARGVDAARVDIAEAAQAYFAAFRDSTAAHARWGARFATGHDALSTAAGCWAEDFRAVCAHHASEFVPAIRHFGRAYALALASGQPRRAVIAATNTGDSLNHLNDYPAALEWMQRGLDLARAAGGPGAMGVALLQTAHTLRLLDRLDASREMLHEALALMAPLSASRNHAYAMWQLVEVELAAGRPADALAAARALAERADALQQSDLRSHARCGQARALLALGEPAPALAAAAAALHHAEGAPNLQVAALRVMADVHAADAERALPAPADLQAPSITLHYLLRALALADGIARFTAPGELLDAAAREHARLGDYRQAYEFSQRASVSRETSRSQEARNRAVAMEVTHETERARADAEHQRSLARAQAERLEMLERLAGSDTLTGLSNRLRLDQVLGEQAARQARSGTPVSVILLDLDHFKSVNDQHGHPVGDRVLVATGALLTASSRQTDEVGRWGGEEFLLVCGDTDLPGARALAQKLRQRIAAHDFGAVGRRTASFGVAQLAAGEDVASLVARADVALYRAKAAGRDRVETA